MDRLLRIIFFGSFLHYSTHVLSFLHDRFEVTAVVTTPPKPKGRHLTPTPTDVSDFARERKLPLFEPHVLDTIPESLHKPDFLVVAGFGKLIPAAWLTFPSIMPVNMHPSLLPHLRGAFPAEWAILRGEPKTGVSLVKMSEVFDKGEILTQQDHPIGPQDTRETLYRTLYDLGAKLLAEFLPKIASGDVLPKPQRQGDFFYAKRLSRDDGFIPWNIIRSAMEGNDIPYDQRPTTLSLVPCPLSQAIERASRALSGWPGVWTEIETRDRRQVKGKKRLKILSAHIEGNQLVIDTVQIEGKKSVSYAQFSKAHQTS